MVFTGFYRFFFSFLLPFNITLFFNADLYFGGKGHIKCLLWSQGAWYLQYRAFKNNKLHWKKKYLFSILSCSSDLFLSATHLSPLHRFFLWGAFFDLLCSLALFPILPSCSFSPPWTSVCVTGERTVTVPRHSCPPLSPPIFPSFSLAGSPVHLVSVSHLPFPHRKAPPSLLYSVNLFLHPPPLSLSPQGFHL